MNNLLVTNENFTNGYLGNWLNILSLLIILFGISVIITKNPIVSVLFLITLFSNVSFYLILLGISFIGLSYLIVYIGAVSILFLFILMLINIRTSELLSNTGNSIPLAIITAILFNSPLFEILPYNIVISSSNNNSLSYWFHRVSFDFNINNVKSDLYNSDVFFVTSKMWDGYLIETGHITSIGNILYTNYNIWLIMASFILLLAMVGAIVITIKQKN